ncbi:MAG: 4Fe-4S binding protein [Clostridiales bacterium]|nr:4Fe-4S binding protein [Clostridiales bacterium]
MKNPRYIIKVNNAACKACGICVVLCPKGVYAEDAAKKAVAVNTEACIGCLLCEIHCPDFAIEVAADLETLNQGKSAAL